MTNNWFKNLYSLAVNRRQKEGLFMMKKLLCKITLALLVLSTILGTTALSAFADTTDTTTATLNNAKVSINGANPVTIQCYNIDGNNYFRVRDLAKQLNFKVTPNYNGQQGVIILPNQDYTESSPSPTLTKTPVSVTIGTVPIYYGTVQSTIQSFNLDSSNYFKLQDMVNAADNTLQLRLQVVKSVASDHATHQIAPYEPLTTIKLTWDGSTNTIKINTVVTDLQKVYTDTRNGAQTSAKTTTPSATTPLPTSTPVNTTQPALTSAPTVGSFLSNILIDKSKGAYVDNDPTKGILWSNITDIYKNLPQYIFGQCTWYATGRFKEVTGIDATKTPNDFMFNSLTNWVSEAATGKYPAIKGITDSKSIVANSIAVWSTHVVFIEYVERDSNGNPTKVYFTEANFHDNAHTKGVYYPDYDGKVEKLSFTDFVKHCGNSDPLLGYIAAK